MRDFFQGSVGAVYDPEVIPEGTGNPKVRDLVLAIEKKGPAIGWTSVLVPFLPVPVVHDFPGAQGVVAIGREMCHHGTRVLEDLVLVPVLEAELSRGVRVDSGGKTGPRWVADRDVAMGLGEGYSALDELP